MKKWLITLLAVPLLLIGCNNTEQKSEIDTNEDPADIASLEVKVEILTPDQVEVGKPVELAAHVTQNNENVEDADAVQFEVWESGLREQGVMIDAEHAGDGVYKAEFTFNHDGVYYMYAHTTARGLHVMPKKQIVAGNPDMSKVLPEKDTSKEDAEKMQLDNQENTESHDETH
ncbi:FixH family protein [Ureibacillus sp. FSL K6-8385]|uniref:FixH family protein n=1 Tax=Ureibacillus terrenus TaxID=118246 RepID=A0A540V1Z7_9BACL|nr:FixH family protein [Ureibacillus terrenus]MED3661040.1 FixH family protein [Ureibacillus terrenus]MED3763326.1 FixH family protein [Ureibacillus terrenus]TQE90741.1 FixH family protein [Ureibacillus terrenus]